MPSKLNKTIILTDEDRNIPLSNKTICGDCLEIIPTLSKQSVDLLILDPPYNLTKTFNGQKFSKCSIPNYSNYLNNLVITLEPLLKPTATIYVCGDWFSSISIFNVCSEHFLVHNRITWEREKGRGAKTNWKNCSEDIWFCTMSKDYIFNIVKSRRKVLAPYRNQDGTPKDWQDGFRDTYPSNLWTDITVPFWSMPENTKHPTQKPEKLIAKLILASSNPGQLVLDPFLGSGTTSVVAKKLNRDYLGIEMNIEYCLIAEKRLRMENTVIQGYKDSVFWARNS